VAARRKHSQADPGTGSGRSSGLDTQRQPPYHCGAGNAGSTRGTQADQRVGGVDEVANVSPLDLIQGMPTDAAASDVGLEPAVF
jgi:hypothetical protein